MSHHGNDVLKTLYVEAGWIVGDDGTSYGEVLREFNHVNPQDDDEGKVFGDARNMLHLNVAACLLKLGEWRKSVETCNKVLEAKPGHVKGLYRRGMAYMAGGEYEDARNDFNMVPKGHVWIPGDNLHASTDSRNFGSIPYNLIEVKAQPRCFGPLR